MAITLKYWNARGLMDVPRMMLALNGKPPGDGYTDMRFARDEAVPGIAELWTDNAVQQTLTMNLGRMPLMEVGGEAIGQSAAINHYLATEFGMMGGSALEGAKIINIVEHVKEMSAARMNVMPFGKEVTPEMVDKWFNTGADDKSPAPADGAGRNERYLKWWIARIEACVGDGGFAVGSKTSLADVVIFRTFADGTSNTQEAMGSKEHTDKALASCPKLKLICETMAANPNMQKFLAWRAERGL